MYKWIYTRISTKFTDMQILKTSRKGWKNIALLQSFLRGISWNILNYHKIYILYRQKLLLKLLLLYTVRLHLVQLKVKSKEWTCYGMRLSLVVLYPYTCVYAVHNPKLFFCILVNLVSGRRGYRTSLRGMRVVKRKYYTKREIF